MTAQTDALYDTAARYGVRYEGTLVGSDYHDGVSNVHMTLAEVGKACGKITRLRILAEAGHADISYVHATLPDGTIVHVSDHPGSFRNGMRNANSTLIRWATESHVYGKGMGLLDRSNWSVMY